ncbi:MAG: hypothetical protein WCS88_04700 [Patescibacteria group bacterium]|jgi:hypothetical protein
MNFLHNKNIVKIKKAYARFKAPYRQKLEEEYYEYFSYLFTRAFEVGGVSYLFALLRVSGMQSAGWDSFIESDEALKDYSKILRKTKKNSKKVDKLSFRLALLMYSHATEMSAPYEIISNLINCIANKPYLIRPFCEFEKNRREPLHPKSKIEHIKNKARAIGENKLPNILFGFFNEDIRNAFYHSDYTITENEFRITREDEIPKSIKLEEVSDKLTRCFAFYSAFFTAYKNARATFNKMPRNYFKWPDFEVFELVKNKKTGLVGFKIHHSTGTVSSFNRLDDGSVDAMNLIFSPNGQIGLQIGNLDERKDKWLVDGEEFFEYGTRYNGSNKWQPIVFKGDPDIVSKKVRALDTSEDIQGILFYVECTGYKAIEFVIKSDKKLFRGKNYSTPKFGNLEKILIEEFKSTDSTTYIYDGTVYLKDASIGNIKNNLDRIKKIENKFKKKNQDINIMLKYSIYGGAGVQKNDNGTISISFSMSNPRNTMVVSDLSILPSSDWTIKEEWI